MNEFTLAFINCGYNVHKSPVRYFDSFIAIETDKVLYEEMMTNDDNLGSNLLTSSFIENT